MSAAKVAAKHNESLPADVKQLKGMRLRDHVAAGRAGCSPLGKGPAPVIPKLVVDSLSTHVSMSQINGNELKPRAIKATIMALVKGTTARAAHTLEAAARQVSRVASTVRAARNAQGPLRQPALDVPHVHERGPLL